MARIKYKKVNKLTKVESAYIAGIIDGEGSITLSFKQKGGTRHLAVVVSNTELPLLKYILKIIGAGKITTKKAYKKHYLQSYAYAIYNRQALDVLKQSFSYLHTYKLKRAKLVLKEYISVTPRNGKYNSELLKKREKFVEKFFLIKQ